MTKSNQKKTALYCRLSQDDGNQGDSNSIQNQKAILMQYAKDHGFQNPVFYVDDGYSGANFNRPDFQRMITDMENGEISAALLSDTFAYAMVKDGKLRAVRSLLDSDFQDDNCCVMAMNGTFVKENPVHAKKIVQCVQKAHCWMRENGADATQFLMDKGWNSGDFDMNVLLNNSLQFGVSDECTEASLRNITENYVRLGLITNMDNVDEIMELAWIPVLD